MSNKTKPGFILPLLTTGAISMLTITSIFATNPVFASIASFDAKDFCKNGSTGCVKQDVSGKSGTISCPQGKVISNVYVHAGDGQTVYQLPDNGFSTLYVNNNNTVTVTLTNHPHDLSWLGVTCAAATTPTNTPTATPTASQVSPTPSDTPTPTCTPTPTDDPGTPLTVTDTPTDTPIPTLTNTPTTTPDPATPTPTPTSTSSSNNDSSTTSGVHDSVSVSTPTVLGTTTLANTGTFSENLNKLLFLVGLSTTLLAAKVYGKKISTK